MELIIRDIRLINRDSKMVYFIRSIQSNGVTNLQSETNIVSVNLSHLFREIQKGNGVWKIIE